MPDVQVTVTVTVPEHDTYTSVRLVRLPEKGLGPKHLKELVKQQLMDARDRLVEKDG